MTGTHGICGATILAVLGTFAVTPTARATETPWGKPMNGLSTRLTLVEGSKIGEPVKVRLELKNVANDDRTYDDQQAAVNNSLNVQGPDNKPVPYTDLIYQTVGHKHVLKPGQSVTIIDSLDVAKQYLLDTPGAYTVQFRGVDELPASNVLKIELKPGGLPDIARVYRSLRAVAPQGWRVAKTANAVYVSRSPTSDKRDITTVQLWFTKNKKSGYENGAGPSNLEYVGETRLGHAWLSADEGVKTHWPRYAQDVREIVRQFAAADAPANDKE